MTTVRIAIVMVLLLSTKQVLAVCPTLWEDGKEDVPFDVFGGGPADSLPVVGQSLFALSTGTDRSKATAQYALSASGAEDLSDLKESSSKRACSHALSFALSSPIDKSDGITDLATLDGLADAFTLTVSYYRHFDKVSLNPGKKVGEEGALRLSRGWFGGGSATIGREEFEYIDFDAFGAKEGNRHPWSLSVSAGRVVGGWTVTGRIKVEESYKKERSATRCRPIPSSSDLNCISGPSEVPNRVHGRQVSVEFRRQLLGGRVGVAPAVHHDVEMDVIGINVPIFLWQDSKGQLTGGFRVGWRSDTDASEVGLFISQPF